MANGLFEQLYLDGYRVVTSRDCLCYSSVHGGEQVDKFIDDCYTGRIPLLYPRIALPNFQCCLYM